MCIKEVHEYNSYSRMRTYRSCGYKYNFIYNMGYVPLVAEVAPTLGSAGHAGLAAGYLGQSVDEALERWKSDFVSNHPMYTIGDMDVVRVLGEMADEVVQQACVIVPRALEELCLEEWEFLTYKGKPLVEVKFAFPLDRWKGFTAVIDAVAKHKPTNRVWVIDNKFRKTLQSDEIEEMDIQLPIYQQGLWSLGIETIGTMTNQILSKVPAQPKLNKDGSMSRARISTTWDVYRNALLANNLDPVCYLEMKDKLDVEFFRQTYVYRNRQQVQAIWDEIVRKTAVEMRDNPSYVRNLGSLGCRSCGIKEYCMEDLRGGDIEYMLETMFMPRSVSHHQDEILNEKEDDAE